MSLFLLDTDTISLVQHNGHALLETIQARRTLGDEVGVTSVTIEEQMEGWFAAIRSAKSDERIESASQGLIKSVEWLASFKLVPLTSIAQSRFKELRRLKLNVGSRDLRIASIALTLDATVVTRNLRDFQRVPGLKVETWT